MSELESVAYGIANAYHYAFPEDVGLFYFIRDAILAMEA